MNAASTINQQKVLRLLEWACAILGAGMCLAVIIAFAMQQLSDLWPLPGLYFIEIALLELLVLASCIADTNPDGPAWGAVYWGAGGVLLAFVILGGFSIGLYLFPAMIAFWLAGAAADLRQRRSLARHFGLAIVAALLQGTLMFAIIALSGARG